MSTQVDQVILIMDVNISIFTRQQGLKVRLLADEKEYLLILKGR